MSEIIFRMNGAPLSAVGRRVDIAVRQIRRMDRLASGSLAVDVRTIKRGWKLTWKGLTLTPVDGGLGRDELLTLYLAAQAVMFSDGESEREVFIMEYREKLAGEERWDVELTVEEI